MAKWRSAGMFWGKGGTKEWLGCNPFGWRCITLKYSSQFKNILGTYDELWTMEIYVLLILSPQRADSPMGETNLNTINYTCYKAT